MKQNAKDHAKVFGLCCKERKEYKQTQRVLMTKENQYIKANVNSSEIFHASL